MLENYRLQQWPLVQNKDYYFRDLLNQKGSNSKKGLLRLCQEVSSLGSSLPVFWSSSIFVVSDESRMDVLRWPLCTLLAYFAAFEGKTNQAARRRVVLQKI